MQETLQATITSRDEIRTALYGLLARYFGENLPEESDNIFESGYVNSMFTMQMVSFVERTFGVDVSDDDLKLENFQSVAAICSFIESKSGSKQH